VAHPYSADRDELVSRLRKIEGQVRGIQRMIEKDAYCIDVLTQVSAVVSAMEKVGIRLLRDHIRGCVVDALRDGNASDDRVDELIRVVERFVGT
jgi:DNA-binding FrmR family transcriptional regulator